jgi:hypothetical protein
MHANRATARARRPGRCRHASGHQGSIRRSGRSGRRGPRTDRPPLPDSSAPKCRASWYHGSSSTPYISSSRKTPRTMRGVLRRASSRARAASQLQHTLSLSLHSALSAHCLPPVRPRITASRARLFLAALRAASVHPIAPVSGGRRPRPSPPATDPGARRAPRAAVPPAEAIESFVATNIDELSEFDGEKLKPRFRRLLEKYNERVNAIELDKSTLIDIPPNLD